MTSSRERPSAECKRSGLPTAPHREVTDGLLRPPPLRTGTKQSISVLGHFLSGRLVGRGFFLFPDLSLARPHRWSTRECRKFEPKSRCLIATAALPWLNQCRRSTGLPRASRCRPSQHVAARKCRIRHGLKRDKRQRASPRVRTVGACTSANKLQKNLNRHEDSADWKSPRPCISRSRAARLVSGCPRAHSERVCACFFPPTLQPVVKDLGPVQSEHAPHVTHRSCRPRCV